MRKKLGFLITLLLFVIPAFVYAEPNFKVSLNGNTTVSTSDTIEYTLSLNTDIETVTFETNLKYDTSVLELINITKKDSWEGSNALKSNGNNALKFTNKGTTGETNIVSFKFRVKSTTKTITTITLDEIKLAVNDGNDNTVLTTSTIKKDITIKSDDNTLKNIKIDGKIISGFSSKTYKYDMEVDSLTDTISIESTLNNDKTSEFVKDFGNRKVSLEYGKNVVLIKVKSESGKVATYTLNITRKDDRVANTDLKSIIINGGKIKFNFDKNILSYTIKTYKLEEIEIDAEADDATSKVNADIPKKIIIGQNNIKITVTAVTGDKKEYNLIVNNTEVPTDTRLKNLSVKGQNIGFNSDKYKYYVRYDKSLRKGLTIYNTTISDDVIVEITGNSNLKEGSVVKIVVTAQDGSNTSEYTITLEKDSRINFFLLLDLFIGIILIILIIIQLRKRKKLKKEKEKEYEEEQLYKTKEIKL